MFYEDFSNPKFIGNIKDWVYPINPNFYSDNKCKYESRMLKAVKTFNVLYATFSETNSEEIATIKMYDKDFNSIGDIVLNNPTSQHDYISMWNNVDMIPSECCWYKVIVSSDISYLKIYGI